MCDVGAPLDEPHRGGRHKSVFTYVHDKWQVRPNITLDLGLRHEYYTPVVGFHGQGGMVNYDPETNTLLVAGYGDIPENLGVESYWINFNPRTGISWRINDTNVVRAGYGVSAEGGPAQTGQIYPITQSPESSRTEQLRGGRLVGHWHTGALLRARFQITASCRRRGRCLQQSFSTILLDPHHNGQLRSWNVAYQRILPGAFTAEVAYVGNRANDEWGSENINASYVVGADQAGQPLFVKYGRTANTTVQVQDGRPKTKYHSMQVKVDRRMRNGLMVTNSYTLGRGWDYNNGTPAHPDRFERGVGRTAFDSLHNFTSSFVYMLPWGPQGTWLRDGVLSKVLGDWQVTGLFSAASARRSTSPRAPLVCARRATARCPNATGTPEVLGGIGPNELWFDTSVFSAPAAGTWGNVQRNMLLTGPGYVNLDASIVKIVRFGSRRAEIRADFFNATEHARTTPIRTGRSATRTSAA